MQRKKVSTGTNNAAAIVELDDDEQLVEEVTTTKRIGRQRRQPPPAADEMITVDLDNDDDEIEADATPSYSDTSLAALLYGDGDEPLESQFCTVMIRRNPDSMNDKFLTPCGALTSLPPLRNIELTAERIDIEERVRNEFGGGHYFFQIHFGNQLRSSWKATLSDDPAAVRAAKAERLGLTQPPPVAAVAPAAAAADPMESFIASLKQTAELKSLLFGDTESRMQAEIDRLRTEAETARNAAPPEPVSEELLLWKMAREMPESEARNRLLDKLTPVDEKGDRHWIADLASVVMDNKDTILGLVGSLFGGTAPQAAIKPSITDMMRQPAPPELPTGRPSAFARTPATTKADPAPAEPPPPAGDDNIPGTILPRSEFVATDPDADITKGDETAIDAEITEETKVQKAARSKGVSSTAANK